MFAVYRTISLRYLAKRWFRALLIVCSIALGVATLVATQALTETMDRAGLRATNPLAGTADLLISGSDGSLIDMGLAQEILEVKGVRSADPRVFTKVRLPELKNRAALLVGIDVINEKTENRPWKITWRNDQPHDMMLDMVKEVWKIISNRDPSKNKFSQVELLKSKRLTEAFKKLDISGAESWAFLWEPTLPGLVGGELRKNIGAEKKPVSVNSPDAGKKFKLIQMGTVDASGHFAALGGNTIIVEIRMLNESMGWKNKAHRIDVVLDPDADQAKIQQVVKSLVGNRAQVQTPQQKTEMTQNVFAGMRLGFALCGIASLVVGLFLVFNVLRFSVVERRHEIGVMRSVGATRRQVIFLFLGEAGLLGFLGSLLGIPLGMGLAYLSLRPIKDLLAKVFTQVEANHIDFSLQVTVIAVTAGVLTAIAAALIPAFSASQQNPAEAVRRIPPKPSWRFRTLQIGVSISLVLIGTVFVLLRDFFPDRRIGTIGGMNFALIGGMVAIPMLANVIAILLRPIVRSITGIEGRLASDNLVRSASRTGLVIAALAAGISLVIQTAGTIRSNSDTLAGWITESFNADLYVSSGSPLGNNLDSAVMPASLAAGFESVPGVDRAVPLKATHILYGKGKQIRLMAADAGLLFRMAAKRGAGEPLYQQLSQTRAGIIVSDNFAVLHRIKTGQNITLASPKGPVEFAVLGAVEDYSWNLGSLLIDRKDYVKYWGNDKVEVFNVFLNSGADTEKVRKAIYTQFGAENALEVLTRRQVQNHFFDLIDRIYGIAYGQLIVVMCVAALGVITALLICVLQRRREIGMLRAIGASKVQVVRTVLAEAILMGIIGTIIGVMIGLPLEWYVLNIIMREEFGYTFTMHIPWTELFFIAGAAIFLATAAGLGPALYSVRQRIPEAISYE